MSVPTTVHLFPQRVGSERRSVWSLVPTEVIATASRLKRLARRLAMRIRVRKTVAFAADEGSRQELLSATTDVAVLRISPPGQPDEILKIATTTASQQALANEQRALRELVNQNLPVETARVTAAGQVKSHSWLKQTCITGEPASSSTAPVPALIAAASSAVRPLHDATAVARVLTTRDRERLIDDPIASICEHDPEHAELLLGLGNCLAKALAQTTVVLSRLHGDFAPQNVLMHSESSPTVEGIVDWTLSPELLPPELDLMQFAISLIAARNNDEFGQVVIRLILDAEAPERDLITSVLRAAPNELGFDHAVLLTWLHHVAYALDRNDDLGRNPIWRHFNVDQVADSLPQLVEIH